jgi:hypothetical protein
VRAAGGERERPRGRMRMGTVHARLAQLAAGLGPVTATVAAALLIILGVLVVVYPSLLGWLVGIGLVLAGVALLATALLAPRADADDLDSFPR